ncbi:hypothetical protein V6N11_031198 [Hibiscus sabdariffa]|uniref:Uncharacterized protein n=2 Tax=Hibiscus sabdariffa TaxID=183260 RepID=A0ABR2AH87_9ROSI
MVRWLCSLLWISSIGRSGGRLKSRLHKDSQTVAVFSFISWMASVRLKEFGALEWTEVAVNRRRWRLITCIWLHPGAIHLLVNMLTLVFIGIHLLSCVRISWEVLSSLSIRNNISVGASGAHFGLLGAML